MSKPTGLSEKHWAALRLLANETGGLDGTDQYPSHWLGGLSIARTFEQLRLIERADSFSGPYYRITPAGRALLDEKDGG